MSLARSLKWSFLAELASKGITPVVFIVLARLLTPDDFGVMSAAVMVIAFSQIFWEAGMGKALIQRQTDITEAANVAFWVNIALGWIIAGLLYWGAAPIATTLFQDQRVTPVLHVMTLQVLLGALSSVQTALLQKAMDFKKLFWVRLITVAFPGMASIPLASMGLGYWALVAGTLIGQIVQVLMLWQMSEWRPAWSFQTAVAAGMARFGAWVGFTGILAWFYGWADALIVGKYLGTYELGVYRTGNVFAMMVFGAVFGPIIPVLYSHLSRMNKDRLRLKAAIEKVIRVIALISVPTGIILFVFSEQIGLALFGARWQGIGAVIGILGLTHGLSWVVGMNGEIYRAMSKPAYETTVMIAALLFYLPAYIYAIQIGFDAFLWTRFFLSVIALQLHLYLLNFILSVNTLKFLIYLVKYISITIITVGFIQWLTCRNTHGMWFDLLLGGITSVGLVMALIFVLERNRLLKDIMALVKAR